LKKAICVSGVPPGLKEFHAKTQSIAKAQRLRDSTPLLVLENQVPAGLEFYTNNTILSRIQLFRLNRSRLR
jgi:hypothetical protein